MRSAIWATAAATLTCVAALAAPPPQDPLKGLSPKEATERVVAALKERDAKLANVRYVVRRQGFSLDADGGRNEGRRQVVELRRHPKGNWMCMARYRPGEKEPHEVQICNVAPGGNRIFTRSTTEKRTVSGPLLGGEATTVRSFPFNQLTGFRANEVGPPRTVAEWVEESARTPPRTVTCSTGVHKDRPVVSVAVYDGSYRTRTLWLDPSRDWMTVRIDHVTGPEASKQWSVIEVEDADVVDGMWFALAAVTRSGHAYWPNRTSESRYTVEAVTLGKVTEADLAVPEAPKAPHHPQPAGQ